MSRRLSLTIGSVLNVGALPAADKIPARGFRWRLAWGPITHVRAHPGGRCTVWEQYEVYLAGRGRTRTLWQSHPANVRVNFGHGTDFEGLPGSRVRGKWLP